MGNNVSKDRRLPKPLRYILLVAGVVGVIGGAIEAVQDVIPIKEKAAICEPLIQATGKKALARLDNTPLRLKYKLPQDFDFGGVEQPKSISEIAIAASDKLQLLESLIEEGNMDSNLRKLFFLIAPAGSGKTPLVSYFRKKHKLAYVSLTSLNEELRRINSSSRWAAKESDLKIMGEEVSWLPKLSETALANGLENFVSGLSGESPDFSKGILIDSLDEIHPDSALFLLGVIKEYAAKYPERVVVVVGRGEAFREYFVQNNLQSVQEIKIPNVYVGSNPLFTWFVEENVNFKLQEASTEDKKIKAEELSNNLAALVEKFPFTQHYLYPGSLGNFVVDNVRYSDVPAGRLEALMFQSLIERNKTSHNRPVMSDSGWALYKDALIQIARKYSPRNNGVFLVGPQDTVCVNDGKNFAKVNVGKVLKRSGLVDINPVNVRYLEFVFWPLSLHSFLAEGKLE